MNRAEKHYNKHIKKYELLIEKQNKVISLIGNLRFLIFIAGTILSYFLYHKRFYYYFASSVLVFLILFLWAAVLHSKFIKTRKYSQLIKEINVEGLERINGHWVDFKDTGEEFRDENHSYTYDLDIFGKSSLFQLTNNSSTYTGRSYLKDLFSKPEKNLESILLRQEAIRELAKKVSFRQRLSAEGRAIKDKLQPLDSLYTWAKNKSGNYDSTIIIFASWLLPLITIILTILPFVNNKIHYYVPFILYIFNLGLLYYNSKEKSKILGEVDSFKNTLKIYYNMLKLIEKQHFTSSYLQELELTNASKQIDDLVKVSEMISMRKSSVYLIFDILTLWDFHCLIALEKWKKKCGEKLEMWINGIGKIEAMSSLSIIHYEHPEWAFPSITENTLGYLCAKKLGHPLLPENRVPNDINMDNKNGILLVTGSNMSGKSTFLRTSGINLALAYAGAPVCAESFTASIMDIYTCMRVSDNLEKNISSFYAEILRIKMIVEAAKKGKKIFFLLDEIFKGTNSIDRHHGAKLLIKQLQKCGAVGLVSTHDLELGELEKETEGTVKNYHFEEYYENNKIFFDYKLRNGISTTRNALYLIKLAGIDED